MVMEKASGIYFSSDKLKGQSIIEMIVLAMYEWGMGGDGIWCIMKPFM